MASRKACDDDSNVQEQQPPTRQRIEESGAAPASLESLNDDCLVLILSYLSMNDLNDNVVFCSPRFREARNHESLDQTRTATIACFQRVLQSKLSFLGSLIMDGMTHLKNYTHLRIVGLDRMHTK